jgi:DNA-binding NtrC family response regulator
MKPDQAERAHVLVVEDDEGVRGLISMTLALSNVESTCVGTAAEALSTSRFPMNGVTSYSGSCARRAWSPARQS